MRTSDFTAYCVNEMDSCGGQLKEDKFSGALANKLILNYTIIRSELIVIAWSSNVVPGVSSFAWKAGERELYLKKLTHSNFVKQLLINGARYNTPQQKLSFQS